MLVVIGGLPGTGKTTIARQVAEQIMATYVRIDSIEQAIRTARKSDADVGPAGYEIAYALSKSNLELGRTVVADCVNPVTTTRTAWRDVARASSSPIVEVEVICSDQGEHRRRVEEREIDIPGLILPTWAAVMNRTYEAWREPRVVIDTAQMSVAEAALAIIEAMSRKFSGTRSGS